MLKTLVKCMSKRAEKKLITMPPVGEITLERMTDTRKPSKTLKPKCPNFKTNARTRSCLLWAVRGYSQTKPDELSQRPLRANRPMLAASSTCNNQQTRSRVQLCMQWVPRCNRTDLAVVSLLQWPWFFLSVLDQCRVRLLPSHVELDDISSLMCLTKANVGHACVVEQ